MLVIVKDNNVEQAIRLLKKNSQRAGIFRELKRREAFEKPSEQRKRLKADNIRRLRKSLKKRLEREGY